MTVQIPVMNDPSLRSAAEALAEPLPRASVLARFTATLVTAAQCLDPASVFDPWTMRADDDALEDAPGARHARLLHHLDREPRLILVGEACGYAGARMSGVPFTSEGLLLAGAIPGVSAEAARISTRRLPWREPSATIVWHALHDAGAADCTVLWNAFPWHPHPVGQPMKNRTPDPRERAIGLTPLAALLAVYPRAIVCGVGKQACTSLRELGVRHSPLRHPANGGASAFSAGLRAIAAHATD